MTYALYVIILVSSPFVVLFLGDGLVRWCSGMGDMLRIRAATASRLSPYGSSGQPHIAIAGEAL